MSSSATGRLLQARRCLHESRASATRPPSLLPSLCIVTSTPKLAGCSLFWGPPCTSPAPSSSHNAAVLLSRLHPPLSSFNGSLCGARLYSDPGTRAISSMASARAVTGSARRSGASHRQPAAVPPRRLLSHETPA